MGADHGHEAGRLGSLVADLPGSSRIHLVGAKRGAELAEAYAGADAFLLLSHSEGMSMALLEALSYRLPVIVSPEVEEALPVAAAGAGWTATPATLVNQLTRLSALTDAR